MMIAAFDSLARKHAKEIDEAHDEIGRLLLQNAELLELCERLAGFAAHYAAPSALEAGGNRLLEEARAAIAKATTVEVDGDDDEEGED